MLNRAVILKACGSTVMIGVADAKSNSIDLNSRCASHVYVRGRNRYTVGLPNEKGHPNRNHFIKVPKLINIAQLSLGSNHGAAVDINNNLYTWGMNINGNCGLGSRYVMQIISSIYENKYLAEQTKYLLIFSKTYKFSEKV